MRACRDLLKIREKVAIYVFAYCRAASQTAQPLVSQTDFVERGYSPDRVRLYAPTLPSHLAAFAILFTRC